MCLGRYVTWTGSVTFHRTLNYFSHTARIKYFGQRLSPADCLRCDEMRPG
jgi:hypothetical protein